MGKLLSRLLLVALRKQRLHLQAIMVACFGKLRMRPPNMETPGQVTNYPPSLICSSFLCFCYVSYVEAIIFSTSGCHDVS